MAASPPTHDVPTSVRDANIVIIGGGPAGSIAALLLHGLGVHVTLLERTPDFLDYDVSRAYHLALTPRGAAVAAQVPALMERLVEVGCNDRDGGFSMTNLAPSGRVMHFGSFPSGRERFAGRADLPELACMQHWFLRPRMLDSLKQAVLATDAISVRYGAVVDNMACSRDGEMVVRYRYSGDTHEIRSRLVLACDGRRSPTRAALLREVAADADVVTSSAGLHDVTRDSPAVGLKTGVVIADKAILAAAGSSFHKHLYLISPETRNRAPSRAFRLTSFPTRASDVVTQGGISLMTALPADHALWQVRSVDEAYALFEENFPQIADVRAVISEQSMRRFAECSPIAFPPITRPASLVAHIGTARRGGVVFLGDAAHAFPPDLGQGLNSALVDVSTLLSICTSAPADAAIDDLLAQYERERLPEIEALLRMLTYAAPYQYGQDARMFKLTLFKSVARRKLADWLPRWLSPTIGAMLLSSNLSYVETERRNLQTVARLRAVAAMVISVAVAFVASRLLRTA